MKYLLPFLLAFYIPNINLYSAADENVRRDEAKVYICTGEGAYRYHNNCRCSGLNKCTGEIKLVTISYAKSIKRTPCKRCYK